jgi:hypothetical protein
LLMEHSLMCGSAYYSQVRKMSQKGWKKDDNNDDDYDHY